MNKPIIIAVCFCLVAVLVALVIYPQYKTVADLKFQVDTRKEDIAAFQEYSVQLKSTRQKLETQYSNELSLIDACLPPDPDVLSLLNFLQDTAQDKGFHFTSLTPFSVSLAEGRDNIQEAALSFTVSGSYSALKQFITSLARSARLIDVSSIGFSSSEQEGYFDFKLGIKTHSY